MPEIDVTDVLLDTDVAGERFVVIRRPELVTDLGIRENMEQRIPAIGSVTQTGENSLVREEGYTAQTKTIKVITATKLRGPSTYDGRKYDADIVFWRGDHFVVRTVDDFSQYGAGMVEADCMSIDYVDKPPMNP